MVKLTALRSRTGRAIATF